MTEAQAFYGKLVQHEIAGEDYARNRQKDREDAQQEHVCDRTTHFLTELCSELGMENTYANRAMVADMIQKTF